jgi:uncharacterized protein YsxB (DUF464 family)
MRNEIENFIEYLLRLDLEHLEAEKKEELIYDINDAVLSLEALIEDYEENTKANDF